ncbi:AraC family transcriptional regulator [Dongia sedimenti]|uniref:Helix-turn-helix domain-containing protein n=1 Tax=Dongia sedimenti TaxID=3064282 RepID=A0ABU0YGZ7_9PROT|nr:helix-turn-helix domain-containing protein [Rhodospirillaceae bacterium R-7]
MTASRGDKAIQISRAPHPILQPFVERIWAASPDALAPSTPCERMLPAVSAHLVIRLGGKPLRLFADDADTVGDFVAHAVVGGVRDAAYLKDGSDPAPSVGAVFRPGAAGVFLGAPTGRFAGCHTPLEAFWGGDAERLRMELGEAMGLERRLTILERALMKRLPRIRGIDPAIVQSAVMLGRQRGVGQVAAALDVSHRHFIARFAEAVGLTPKRYARLVRFGRVLRRLERWPETAWAEVAQDAGYADQAHFNRDFRAFSGISPGRYREMGGIGRHVPEKCGR